MICSKAFAPLFCQPFENEFSGTSPIFVPVIGRESDIEPVALG